MLCMIIRYGGRSSCAHHTHVYTYIYITIITGARGTLETKCYRGRRRRRYYLNEKQTRNETEKTKRNRFTFRHVTRIVHRRSTGTDGTASETEKRVSRRRAARQPARRPCVTRITVYRWAILDCESIFWINLNRNEKIGNFRHPARSDSSMLFWPRQ